MLSAIYILLAASAVLCAPMASLDAKTFLQNGKEAQTLNAEFQTLKSADSCNSGEMACIGASVAHCVNATWKAEPCPNSLFCFALPSLREEGVVLSCTSNTTALSVIHASGVTGGLAANSTDKAVDFPMDCDDDDEQDEGDTQSTTVSVTSTATRSHSTQTASPSATGTIASSAATVSATASGRSNDSPVTVTVTVLPTSFSFSTEFSETTTLNPAQASSFLSSIATDTHFSVVTTIRNGGSAAGPTASASLSSAASQESQSFSSKPVGVASAPATAFTSDLGAPTTITLLAARPTSTAVAATTASAAPIDVGDSYYH
ncbi:hypothetical protein BC628DRAFT_1339187 [Trametes gibbosa]|nr:hypothetical protein BC628DRAFT_1339187 [Trametes gibbosa]